jgi:dGTPase
MGNQRLKWKSLLDPTRVRALFGGSPSHIVSGELRTEFERDYGRTIYSTPFRRLREKAQMFPLEPNDSVRTRLLHSLEVSSVAEDLAAQIVRDVVVKHEDRLPEKNLGAIPLVAATCGLIHDIGNPPFGHAGELAISSWFKDRFAADETFVSSLGGANSEMVQDFFTFEGNAQGVRTVANSFLLADHCGLNFTVATQAAALKYVAPSNRLEKDKHEKSKPGFFTSEGEIVRIVRDRAGTSECRHPITYIVEAADDIVYCSVDLEDGIRRGTLDWTEVRKQLLDESGKADIVKEAVHRAEAQVAPARLPGRERSEALAQAFRVAAISLMVIAARKTFKRVYGQIMNGEYHRELLMDESCEAKPLIEAAKRVLRNGLYRHKDILRLEVRGRRVIHDLLDLFWEGVSNYETGEIVSPKSYGGKLYLLFSPNYRRHFEWSLKRPHSNELYCRFQLLTDQIAGMTDSYASRLHKDLTNV